MEHECFIGEMLSSDCCWRFSGKSKGYLSKTEIGLKELCLVNVFCCVIFQSEAECRPPKALL